MVMKHDNWVCDVDEFFRGSRNDFRLILQSNNKIHHTISLSWVLHLHFYGGNIE